jgi:hypothetical protein
MPPVMDCKRAQASQAEHLARGEKAAAHRGPLQRLATPVGLDIISLPLYPEGRPCFRPTARRLIDVFEPIQRQTLDEPDGQTTTRITVLSPLQRKLLRLLGIPATNYER